MAKGNLDRRVTTLEQQTREGLPEVKLIHVDHTNYLAKEIEIEQAGNDGYQVIPLCSVAAKDGKPHPNHVEYHRWLDRNKTNDAPDRLLTNNS